MADTPGTVRVKNDALADELIKAGQMLIARGMALRDYGIEATLTYSKPAIIPPVPHPDAAPYFETVLDVVTDCQKRTGRHPETLRMSTRTANILGSLAVLEPGEKLDVTKGGTIAGMPFELDDALPDGAIQST